MGRKTVKIGNRAYIGFTENGGKDWDFTYLDDETELKTVYFLNRKQGVFTNFAIYYTQDGDQNLSRVNDFGHDKIDHLDFGSPTTGWAAGLGGTVAKTRNGGQSWNYLDVEYSKPFVSVAAIGNRQAWLLSTDLLFHTANGGTTWNEVNLQNAVETTPVRYRAVTFTDTLRGWIVGEFRRILHTTDGGQTWQVQYPRTPQQRSFDSFTDISANDSFNALAVTGHGAILRTKDGGKTWQEQLPAKDEGGSFNNIQFLDKNVAYASGIGPDGVGRLMKTVNGGEVKNKKKQQIP